MVDTLSMCFNLSNECFGWAAGPLMNDEDRFVGWWIWRMKCLFLTSSMVMIQSVAYLVIFIENQFRF
uniref:Putative ovule protein n=1 Tax=Solanum chacoense TaxID=4108 RepID=A0A0V0GN82_SOLCH